MIFKLFALTAVRGRDLTLLYDSRFSLVTFVDKDINNYFLKRFIGAKQKKIVVRKLTAR